MKKPVFDVVVLGTALFLLAQPLEAGAVPDGGATSGLLLLAVGAVALVRKFLRP